MANQAHTNGSDSRPDESARGPLQHQGYDYHREVRRKPNHERAEPHGKHCQAEHKPLRLGRVKQLSSGYLGHQAGNTADGQDKTDVFWRPALTSKKERYKRPKTGQSAPYKKMGLRGLVWVAFEEFRASEAYR